MRVFDGPPVWTARLLGLAALVVLGSTLTPLWNWAAARIRPDQRLEPASAIVVLGATGYEDGSLNSASLRRAIHGIALWHRGLAPTIVLMGAPVSETLTEAAIRSRLARDLGVPAEAILTGDRARTTRDEATHVADLLRPSGATRILLVTGGGHMRRARGLFEQRGFTVLPAPVGEAPFASNVAEDRLDLARIVMGELLARAYYRLAGYL
jgi:uncharacterized SAM-binding protein YcdF (DUF218 family)